MAASVTFTLPCIVIFFLAQRHFVRGIVLSGVKG
jgi:ABC-type glycerol-3-phosphate transport system permease component